MQSGNPAGRSPVLYLLAVLFIGGYFLMFSYDSLNAYFTFDDGLNLVHLHHHWEVPLRNAVVDALQVFTSAYRPLGGLVYRSLYQVYGFNPLPFRMVAYGLLIFNIVLCYRLVRALEASREAAALSTLLFCYNASMMDLFFSTGTIYDLLCFPFYIGGLLVYVRHRSKDQALDGRTMAVVMLLFLGALDCKETAATLPAALLLYEIIYRYSDWKARPVLIRSGGFLLAMFAVTGIYMRIKVGALGNTVNLQPHLSIPFVLNTMGRYVDQLFYLKPESFGAIKVVIGLAVVLGAAAWMRNRAIAFGVLFFALAILPVSVVAVRSGYAAYIAYPGLTLVMGTLLAAGRMALLRVVRRQNLEVASRVALFLCVACITVGCFAETRKNLLGLVLWDQERRMDFFTGLKRHIPELPPNARILVLDDPWGPDWAQMFLTTLLYRDGSLWMDRVKSDVPVGDRDSYDLLVSYKLPKLGTTPSRIFGVRKSWEIHWIALGEGQFTVTAPNESRAPRDIVFSPAAARSGRPVTMTVPGLSNVKIDAIFRVVSEGKPTVHHAEGWCTLDGEGRCQVSAPYAEGQGMLSVDWVRPVKGRWIFTDGVLPLVE